MPHAPKKFTIGDEALRNLPGYRADDGRIVVLDRDGRRVTLEERDLAPERKPGLISRLVNLVFRRR